MKGFSTLGDQSKVFGTAPSTTNYKFKTVTLFY